MRTESDGSSFVHQNGNGRADFQPESGSSPQRNGNDIKSVNNEPLRPWDSRVFVVESIYAKRTSRLPMTDGSEQLEYFVKWVGKDL